MVLLGIDILTHAVYVGCIFVYIYYYGNSPPPPWQINIRKYPIGGYFHSNIYTMEIAPLNGQLTLKTSQ